MDILCLWLQGSRCGNLLFRQEDLLRHTPKFGNYGPVRAFDKQTQCLACMRAVMQTGLQCGTCLLPATCCLLLEQKQSRKGVPQR